MSIFLIIISPPFMIIVSMNNRINRCYMHWTGEVINKMIPSRKVKNTEIIWFHSVSNIIIFRFITALALTHVGILGIPFKGMM